MRTLATNTLPWLLSGIIERAKTSGDIRRPEWLAKRIAKNLVRDVPPGMAGAAQERLASMMEVLDSVHGDRWDASLVPSGEYDPDRPGGERLALRLALVVHCPEIEIQNDLGHSHTIRDLLLAIFLAGDRGELAVDRIRCTRATLTADEYAASYAHSHAAFMYLRNRKHLFNTVDFCFGEDSAVTAQVDSLRRGYTPEGFEMLLWNLDSFLRWESLEGLPYYAIGNIGPGGAAAYRGDPAGDARAFEAIRPRIQRPDIDFALHCGRYAVWDNRRFERHMHALLCATGDEGAMRAALCTREGAGFRGLGRLSPTPEQILEKIGVADGPRPHYMHREDPMPLRIIEGGNSGFDINRCQVHPKFLSYAKAEIENELYLRAVRDGALRRAHRRGHAQ